MSDKLVEKDETSTYLSSADLIKSHYSFLRKALCQVLYLQKRVIKKLHLQPLYMC